MYSIVSLSAKSPKFKLKISFDFRNLNLVHLRILAHLTLVTQGATLCVIRISLILFILFPMVIEIMIELGYFYYRKGIILKEQRR